jgi:hypothetical protein
MAKKKEEFQSEMKCSHKGLHDLKKGIMWNECSINIRNTFKN